MRHVERLAVAVHGELAFQLQDVVASPLLESCCTTAIFDVLAPISLDLLGKREVDDVIRAVASVFVPLCGREDVVRRSDQRFEWAGHRAVPEPSERANRRHRKAWYLDRMRSAGTIRPVALSMRLKSYVHLVDRRLDELLPPADEPPQKLHEAVRYSALAPGKRTRPLLCMASCEAVGGEPEAALDAACALEMVHCFSLIHDDLPAVDDDDLRRGRPTTHKVFGEALAILAGDSLFAQAFYTMARCTDDPRRANAAVIELAASAGSGGLVGGEVFDLEGEGQPPTQEALRRIHDRKTAMLIAASCVVGGLLGGGDRDALERLRAFGHRIGLAFQIVDDILNETGTPEQLGKSAGSDERRRKMTYPSWIGVEAARQESERLATEAVQCLDGLPGDCESLRVLAAAVVNRNS